QAHNNSEEIKEAVITVPSFYDNIQRKAIKEAAESAGIKVLDLLEEPIAGALYYIANKRQKHKLMSMAESLKIDLTMAEQSTFDVTEFSDDVSELIEITREKFENLSKGLIHRINLQVREALHEVTENINKIIYIGGSAKMPMIRENLKKLFPDSEHYYGADTEYGTSVGAMIHALQLYQDRD
ncbi:hypothetical protein FO519_009820, partial [Halicephalobus sp. NKZ332]